MKDDYEKIVELRPGDEIWFGSFGVRVYKFDEPIPIKIISDAEITRIAMKLLKEKFYD